MYELLYYSMASRLLTHKELTEILDKARVKNQQLGITGMLLYYNHEFLQLLEGERPVVKRLYDTIASDPRHRAVEIFYEGHIYQRVLVFRSLNIIPTLSGASTAQNQSFHSF